MSRKCLYYSKEHKCCSILSEDFMNNEVKQDCVGETCPYRVETTLNRVYFVDIPVGQNVWIIFYNDMKGYYAIAYEITGFEYRLGVIRYIAESDYGEFWFGFDKVGKSVFFNSEDADLMAKELNKNMEE